MNGKGVGIGRKGVGGLCCYIIRNDVASESPYTMTTNSYTLDLNMANDIRQTGISVTQDNELIEACYTMSLNEKRLLLLGMSKVNPMEFPSKLEPFKFSITVDEWASNYPDDNPWRAIKRAADMLLVRYVTLHPKTGVVKKLSWFDSVEYHEGEGTVTVQFGWSIQVRLAGMLEQFTKVNLLSVNKLTSIYSIRIYELVSQFLSTGFRVMSIEDFRLATNTQGCYLRMAELKRNVVRPAVKEINEKTDVFVEVEDVKKGRKISGFKFIFKKDEQADMFR